VASFSNHGPWVNAWAPGVDVLSDYPKGLRFVYFNPDGSVAGTGTFDAGMARWSGTSFAAPFAAAEIARYAADHGLSPRDAWATIRSGRPFVIFGR
jgi:subtilisin family serine protease